MQMENVGPEQDYEFPLTRVALVPRAPGQPSRDSRERHILQGSREIARPGPHKRKFFPKRVQSMPRKPMITIPLPATRLAAMIQPRRCILLVVLTVASGSGLRSVVAQQGGEPTLLWQFEAGG
jgi:hypothetical protein